MAQTLTNAGVSPAAATDTLIYTCPAATTSVISNINIANKSTSPTSFRVYIKALGATDYYIYYDITIAGNDTFNRVTGDVMVATDELWVRCTLATCDFLISIAQNT